VCPGEGGRTTEGGKKKIERERGGKWMETAIRLELSLQEIGTGWKKYHREGGEERKKLQREKPKSRGLKPSHPRDLFLNKTI